LVGSAVLWPDQRSEGFGWRQDRPMTRPMSLGTKRNARVRCAIYTRKSSEEGLEQEFNSLLAQREAWGGGNQPLRIQLCKVGSTQDREEFGSNQDFDAACDPRLSTDQPGSFEGEHHLMDGWWADAKVALQIGFGWRTAEDVRIGVDECQILTLLGCEAWTSWRRRQVCPQFGSRGCRPSRI